MQKLYAAIRKLFFPWIHSASLGTDTPSKPQPSNFLSPQALKNITSPPGQTKNHNNSNMLHMCNKKNKEHSSPPPPMQVFVAETL